jgi:ATP-dependent RNA helicase DDX18/HAS1
MEKTQKNILNSRKKDKIQKNLLKKDEEIDIEENEINEQKHFIQKEKTENKKQEKKEKKKEEKIESESGSEMEEEEEELEVEEKSSSLKNEEEEKNENKSTDIKKDKYFSNIKFEEFDIDPKTLLSLTENNFFTATEIQAKTIPLSLSGADIMGSAKTGSGKSLAFLIPAVESVIKSKHLSGTKVIILTPTRELALQLYNLAKDLLMYHKETCALIIGGANRKTEAEKLKSGASIIIATPGRLLDHMKNTKNFTYQNNCMLIIDEADAILKIGFEQELKDIINLLPKKRQSLLFSATMSSKLDDIIRLSLKNPIQISTKSDEATVSNLEQGYVIIEPDHKFLLLYTFLRKNPNKKIIVFFSSCKEVEFYNHLLNYVDISVLSTHGGQKQQKRTATFFEFSNMETGILLCTDVVQRGLDFPDVDWIIQYDPPHSNINLFYFI